MNEKRTEQNKKDKGNITLQLKEKDELFYLFISKISVQIKILQKVAHLK